MNLQLFAKEVFNSVNCLWFYVILKGYSIRSGFKTSNTPDKLESQNCTLTRSSTDKYNFYTYTELRTEITEPPSFLQFLPIANKNAIYIECCGSKIHQILANIMQSQYLKLKISLLWRPNLSGYLPVPRLRPKIFGCPAANMI